MNNIADVESILKAEIDIWFPKQCADPSPFYLFYMETTPEHDGGLLIARDKGANPDFHNVAAQLNIGDTKEQNFNRLRAICAKLPILACE